MLWQVVVPEEPGLAVTVALSGVSHTQAQVQ